ncbi:MAG: hypothetical protein IKU60_05065 [Clostridia bacterium]|nr:hypothetical protein [Clostridia bacterium]
MGRFYEYKCPKCNFSKEMHVGGGFFSKKYWEETEQQEKELRAKISEGKYGDYVRKLVECDTGNKLRFICNTDVFQCEKCFGLMIERKREIFYDTDDYEMVIEFKKTCPECKGGKLRKHPESIRCPECKEVPLKLEKFGSWD